MSERPAPESNTIPAAGAWSGRFSEPMTERVKRYTASVDFGTGFRPVDGYVSATTAGYDVQVVEVRTALVDKTCAEDPQGPGC